MNPREGYGLSRPAKVSSSKEIVLVQIIGTETGGGRYKGSILKGNSTGIVANTFQLVSNSVNNYMDGPAPMTSQQSGSSTSTPNNNALVMNLSEQSVPNSHFLYLKGPGTVQIPYYALGRVVGKTSEKTPRSIIYIESGPAVPVLVRIGGSMGAKGILAYYGRILTPVFVANSPTGTVQTQDLNASIPASDNCVISNIWEETNVIAGDVGGNSQLNAGYIYPGMLVATVPFSYPNGQPSTQPSYLVMINIVPQAAALSISTSQTLKAGATYGSNEQLMLTTVYNLFFQLYNNLQTAGIFGRD
jgi:hypothetical protein